MKITVILFTNLIFRSMEGGQETVVQSEIEVKSLNGKIIKEKFENIQI